MQRIERRIDVSAAAGLGEIVEMAVTLHLPDPATLPERPVAIVASPGGGYSRRYFDLRFAGRDGYSEAEWHVARGTIHIAIDHVGTGDSSIPDLSRITTATLAATHDACVRHLLAELREGRAAYDFPPVAPFAIGMGQSMGGAVTILTQGRFAPFDAIAPCGVSAIHTVIPQRDGASVEQGIRRYQAAAEGRARNLDELDHGGIDYRYGFHWEDVPVELVDEDMRGGYPIRKTAPSYGSLTIPHCAVRMMLPGALAEEAALVAVPVFIGLGERDTCRDPLAEPGAYARSRDVTVFIVPEMAHMHNFASTRERLWRRLHIWSRGLAGDIVEPGPVPRQPAR